MGVVYVRLTEPAVEIQLDKAECDLVSVCTGTLPH